MGKAREPLLRVENHLTALVIGMMTVVETSEEDVLEGHLNTKVKDVVKANPWLSGEIIRDDDGVFLEFDDDPKEGGEFFQFVDFSGVLSKAATYADMKLHLLSHMVPRAFPNSGAQLFKVVLAKLKEENTFGIIFSLSHGVADGATFFQLQKSLYEGQDVVSLKPERFTFWDEENKFGNHMASKLSEYLQSGKALVGILARRLFASFSFFQPQVRGGVFAIDKDYVSKRKAQSSMRLSTNDIVTSWFLRSCAGKENEGAADNVRLSRRKFLAMVINLRTRVKGVRNSMSANYLSVIPFTKEDNISPEGVREAMNAFARRNEGAEETPDVDDDKVPTLFETARGSFGIITNWAGFYTEPKFPSTRVLHQLPLLPLEDIGVASICVFFNFKPGIPAVFVSSQLFGSEKFHLDNPLLETKLKSI